MARKLELAEVMRATMKSKGLTQAAVAERVGVSATAVGNWLKGTQPGSSLIDPIAATLDIDPNEVRRLAGYGPPDVVMEGIRSRQVVDRLSIIAATLPADRLETLLDFAEYLGLKDWRQERQEFALANLARAYGDDEPEYTLADIKS